MAEESIGQLEFRNEIDPRFDLICA